MKRAIFVLGTWQLITATASLIQARINENIDCEDFLILYGHDLSNQLKETMEKLSVVLWHWKKIIWVDDILNTQNYTENYKVNVFNILRKRIGIKNLNEVWVSKLNNPLEKIIFDTYENSNIVLFEDGLWVYAPQKIYTQELSIKLFLYPRKLFKFIRSKLFKKNNMLHYKINGIRLDHIQRLRKAYLFINKYISKPDYLERIQIEQLQTINMRSVIDHIRKSTGPNLLVTKPIKYNQKTFLLLAQNFSKNDMMVKRTEEIECYLNVTKELINRGYYIYWKEHPRTNFDFYNEIIKKLDDRQINYFCKLNVPSSYPIEIFINELKLSGCVSCTSSGLFSIKDLFDIPTYTIVNRIAKFRSRDHREMKKIVLENIPKLDRILS